MVDQTNVLPMEKVTPVDQECCFSAVRGIQAGRHFFTFMCPLHLIPVLFRSREDGGAADMRAQRTLNRSRIPKIAKYIVDNPETYVFSAIAASVKLGATRFDDFEGGSGNVGKLYISFSERLMINDGQHRRAAIMEALSMKPSLEHESIPVVLFVEGGLESAQQMFADLNRHAIRPNKSLNVLYDHRDELASLVVKVVQAHPVFRTLVELEKTQISNRTKKLFTLNSIFEGSREFLGLPRGAKPKRPSADQKLVLKFWRQISLRFPQWTDVLDGRGTCKQLRDETITASGLLMVALGLVGRKLMTADPDNWVNRLEGLQEINWERDNPIWQGVAIQNGRLSKRREHVLGTAELIMKELGVQQSVLESVGV